MGYNSPYPHLKGAILEVLALVPNKITLLHANELNGKFR